MDEASWNPSPKYAPNKLKESGGAYTSGSQVLEEYWKQEKVCPKQAKRVGWGIYSMKSGAGRVLEARKSMPQTS